MPPFKDNYHYGVIGNCTTAALVSTKGSIDWLCLPDFDSPSVFAGLLDDRIGGCFQIEVSDDYDVSQKYIKNTNILITRFAGLDGSFDVIDFAPRFRHAGKSGSYYCPPEIIRLLRHRDGKPRIRIRFEPRLMYAKEQIKTERHNDYIKSYTQTGIYESVYLYSDLDYESMICQDAITLTKSCFLCLSYHQKIILPNYEEVFLYYEKTKVYWMDWVSRTTFFPKHNDEINRSALVLKLMTYQESGAVLAALTTSLPESLGSVRNWDYRFCWIRDASMTISVFADLGHPNTVRRFIRYILSLISTKDEKIQVMYGIHGGKKLEEEILDHLNGYLGSKPVRIGNAAYTQKQNDIYGILLDVLYKSLDFFDYKFDSLEDIWTIVRTLVRNVEHHWKEPDRGIWEYRGKEEHFVFSKVLCWVALDRGVLIANRFKKHEYVDHWTNIRDEIKKDILENGWNDEVGAFTQYYGATSMDSANLLMQDYGFIEATDPQFVATVEKTFTELSFNGLMFRYKQEDDFGQPESSFTVCSFWMVECLFKIGKRKQARAMFEKLLTYSNHLGLFSEDIDFRTKRLLGNFPQAYSHLALISAAELLASEEELEEEKEMFNEMLD